MADIIDTTIHTPTERVVPASSGQESPWLWSRIALGAVVLLSIFMNFFQLGQNGYGNLYYAAGVRSMADSLHNFFFVSFDPGGFVTIDKPPLGFWLQTLSTKIFGFTPFSIFFPQALCGVLAVLLLYYLVRRHFGVVAALIAALALAVSPISVVTNRNNTIDGTLALALLLAAWAVIHAAETGKLRWLLLSAVFVGLGFNILEKDYHSGGWRGWLLPIALIVTAGAQIYMLSSYPTWSAWMSPLIGILTALTVIALIVLRLRPQLKLSTSTVRVAVIAVSVGMFALLVAPTIWSGYSVIRNTESSAPAAGPTAQGNGSSFPGANGQSTRNTRIEQNNVADLARAFGVDGAAQTDPALISYLEAHQGNAKFLVAVPSANAGAPIILATNKPVMAMGGFSGGDPILTVSDLQALINTGTVRYFLISSSQSTQRLIDELPEQYREVLPGRGGFGGFGQQSALSSWISKHCSTVPTSDWSSAGRSSATGNQLYDCAAPKA